MPKLDDQISLLEQRLRQLKLRQQRADSRRRMLDAARERKTAARRKFLVGEVVLDKVAVGEIEPERLRAWLDSALTRSDDRALFELAPKAGAPDTPSSEGRPSHPAGEAETPPGIEGDHRDGI